TGNAPRCPYAESAIRIRPPNTPASAGLPRRLPPPNDRSLSDIDPNLDASEEPAGSIPSSDSKQSPAAQSPVAGGGGSGSGGSGGAGSGGPGGGGEGGDVSPVTIEEEMRRSYLDYAMSVIVSRALPDVRDGLKP